MRTILPVIAALVAAFPVYAQTGTTGPLNGYVDSVAGGLQSQITPLQTWSDSMTIKSSTIPTTAPGAGKCLQSIVPSNLVTSGGVTGSAGTCALIEMCGTSTTPVVKTLNIGSGC